MVQIIQSQPTQRQSALELALGQAVNNFGSSYMQGQQTLRQQALQEQALKSAQESQDLQTTLKLSELGIASPLADVKAFAKGAYTPKEITPAQAATPDAFTDAPQGTPVTSPADLRIQDEGRAPQVFTRGKEATPAVMGPANPMLNYTETKKAKIAADLLKQQQEGKLLTAKVEAIPIDNQKKQAEIEKLNQDVQMRPLEKQAKLADIEWKHSQASAKVDEKTDKRFSDFAKQVSNPTTRNALGNFGKNLAAADRIRVLTDSYTNGAKPGSTEEIAGLNQLSSQQSEEVTKSLDSLLSGGASTISGADHLRFQTLASQWSDLKAKYGNSPQGAELGAFLSRALETVTREREYNAKQVDRILGGLGEGYSDLRKKDSGRFQNILGSAYDKGELPVTHASSAISHPDAVKNARMQELLKKANQ